MENKFWLDGFFSKLFRNLIWLRICESPEKGDIISISWIYMTTLSFFSKYFAASVSKIILWEILLASDNFFVTIFFVIKLTQNFRLHILYSSCFFTHLANQKRKLFFFFSFKSSWNTVVQGFTILLIHSPLTFFLCKQNSKWSN